MIDGEAKDHLLEALGGARDALIAKLDGLGEYDVRRPLTPTGTNLLGLVKHCATWEATYLGEIFGRPFPGLPRWQDIDGSDLWVRADESREQVVEFARLAREHAEATVRDRPLDAPGRVPWWPRPDVTLFAVLLHVIEDTTRHAGHADILREGLDGRTGDGVTQQPVDLAARAARWDQIDAAARAASA